MCRVDHVANASVLGDHAVGFCESPDCRATTMTRSSSHTLAQRYAKGLKLRRKISRQNHADLLGPADRDPVAILAAGDRTRLPNLIPVRYQRMLASPFAFLRGAAAVMAQDLKHQP